uniref:Uncharacterized protein n=1 Tax=Rhizophora mucronata TaxID=61149 RepID=A0A2P2IZP6_RHIMU
MSSTAVPSLPFLNHRLLSPLYIGDRFH